jgi:hypothetical protein
MSKQLIELEPDKNWSEPTPPTPRPWSEFCESGDWWIAQKDEDGMPGASVCDANDMSAADMFLIVNAVNMHDELLRMCEAALVDVRDAQGEIRDRSYLKPRLRRLEEQLRTTIAKARGISS